MRGAPQRSGPSGWTFPDGGTSHSLSQYESRPDERRTDRTATGFYPIAGKAMDCQEFLRLHSEYLDARLPPEESDRCDAHAASCASCARYDRVVRRGVEVLRRLPPVPVSPDFMGRLDARIESARDDVFAARSTGAASGVVVSLGIAALLALAAWGPLLSGAPDATADRIVEVERGYTQPVAESLMPLPAPDWWEAPATGAAFGGVRHVPPVETAFPGPYSPLIVMPPVVDRGRGGGYIVPAHLTALD